MLKLISSQIFECLFQEYFEFYCHDWNQLSSMVQMSLMRFFIVAQIIILFPKGICIYIAYMCPS